MMEGDITRNPLTRAPQLQLGIVLVYTTSFTIIVFIKGIIIIISNEAIHIHAATITANIAITDITVITTIMAIIILKSNIIIIYNKAINLDIRAFQQLLKGLATIVITVNTDVSGPGLK